MRELIFIMVSGLDPIMVLLAIVLAFLLRRTGYAAVVIVPALTILASYLLTRGLGGLPPPVQIQLLKATGIAWSSALIAFLVVYFSRRRSRRKEKELATDQ